MKLEDVEKMAMELPETEREVLAHNLFRSLPDAFDEDDGIAEAKRRSKEMDDDPSMGMSWDEVKKAVGR